jgi:hypothetical protein
MESSCKRGQVSLCPLALIGGGGEGGGEEAGSGVHSYEDFRGVELPQVSLNNNPLCLSQQCSH